MISIVGTRDASGSPLIRVLFIPPVGDAQDSRPRRFVLSADAGGQWMFIGRAG